VTSPSPRRILAVDYGDRRTGLAGTDWTGSVCLPLERLDLSDPQALAQAIAELVRERDAQVVVIGMPLLHDGQAGQRAQKTERFRALLAAAVAPTPVEAVDESHTTDEAHERMKELGLKASKRRNFADSIAALVILERFVAQERSPRRPPT
jgi:putative Holliday junction resolvase